MSAFPNACNNAASLLFQRGDLAGTAAYVWLARWARPGAPDDGRAEALRSLLGDQAIKALAAGEADAASRYDNLAAIFDAQAPGRLSEAQRSIRAAARRDDAQGALDAGVIDRAIAHYLAAKAFDPSDPSLFGLKDRLIGMLLERVDQGLVEAEAAMAPIGLGFAVALGASSHLSRFLALLQERGDFETVVNLAGHVMTAASYGDEERLAAQSRRLAALQAIEERDRAAAEAKALLALGPPDNLNSDQLRRRLARCYGLDGYRGTLADLRELRRREPSDPWSAKNLCILLGDVAFPEVAAAVDLVVADTREDQAELEANFTLLWSIGAARQALALADRLARYRPEFGALAALHAMALDEAAAPALTLPRARQSPRAIYATLACWGEKYLDLMERTCFASLLAPGNLPALAEKADIILEIYTMPADLPRLSASRRLRRLAEHCEIRIHCFPEAAGPHRAPLTYHLLGMATHATLLRAAARGGDLLFLYADVVLAQDCLTAIAERLADRPRGVFGDPLNLYATPLLNRLDSRRQGDALIVSSGDLLQSAADCLGKRMTNTFYRTMDPRTPDHVCRVVFATEHGLRTHGFIIAPLYFSNAAFAPVLHPDFGTQDGRIVEHVLNKLDDDQIDVLSGADYCAAELCDDDDAARPIVAYGLEGAIERFFTSYRLSRRRHTLFQRPIDFPGLFAPGEALVSEQEVARQVESINNLFDHSPLLKDIAVEQQALRAQRHGADQKASTGAAPVMSGQGDR